MSTLIIISCICMFFIIGRIFFIPIKWILKFIFNSIIGGFLIWLINFIGSAWGFHIGLNIVTSLVIGILGIPGAIILVFIKLII